MKFLTVFIFVICCGTLKAQDYQKGIINFKNGDLMSGFIKETSFKSLSDMITFKSSLEAEAKVFSTESVKSFIFGKQKFSNETINQTIGNRFLLVLNEGKYSLFRDYQGFYVKSSNEAELIPLIRSQKRLFKGDYVDMIVFRFQLDSICRVCPKMNGQAMRLIYTDKDISKLITELNNCLGDSSATNLIKSEPKAVKKIGIRGVSGVSQIIFRDNQTIKNIRTLGNIYGFGLFLNTIGGSIGNGRIGSQLGFDIIKVNYDKKYNYRPTNVQASFLVQYALSSVKEKIYTYVEAGIQSNFALKSTNSTYYVGEPKGLYTLSIPVGLGITRKLSKRNDFISNVRFTSNKNYILNRTSNILFMAAVTF